jgi:hypothetical protein
MRQRATQYRRTNADLVREKDRERSQENKAANAAYQVEYRKKNRDRLIAVDAQRRRLRKQAALDAYGHQCVCCGESGFVFLTIDHIVSGVPDSGNPQGLMKWLKVNKYPPGFQTLCMNCNVAKRNWPACPHKYPVTFSDTRRRLKLATLAAYGGTCRCCGEDGPSFLQIHHPLGDGRAHRASLDRKSASSFYASLQRLGWPNDPPLEVLCANCNWAVHRGVCPHQCEG